MNVYVECRYCRSCWWRLVVIRGRRTSWYRCCFCDHFRDARTGHTLLAGALN